MMAKHEFKCAVCGRAVVRIISGEGYGSRASTIQYVGGGCGTYDFSEGLGKDKHFCSIAHRKEWLDAHVYVKAYRLTYQAADGETAAVTRRFESEAAMLEYVRAFNEGHKVKGHLRIASHREAENVSNE
jgi:hypothetical protein